MTTMPSSSSADPECPGAPHRHRRCLDCCLVMSLVVLTMAVGFLCTLYFFWEKPSLAYQLRRSTDFQRSSAHLVSRHEHIKNMTMEWDVLFGSAFVGHDSRNDSTRFQVGRSGLYYIYSQMALSCIDLDNCKESGSLSVSVLKDENKDNPLLKLNVQISESAKNNFPSSFSGRLSYLSEGERLSSHLWVDGEHSGWKLDNKENNFLGLFWVSEGNGGGSSQW